jgi:hypothetical protein
MKSLLIFALASWALAGTAANAQLASGINYNTETPAPPAGALNVHWQHDSSSPIVNTSAYVTYPTFQVACAGLSDISAPVNACIASLPSMLGGICDARACSAATSWSTATSVATANTVVLLPCATITTSQTFTVPAGIRNVRLDGCGYQGGSTAAGTAGATVWVYTGSGAAFSIGDPTYAMDTKGFMLENMNINTASAGSGAQALHFYRAQEIKLDSLYLNGNQSTGQTGIVLDGTGDYTGGTFIDIVANGYGTGWLLTGHLSGSVVDDYANASTFIKAHVDCPTSGGSPISGTIGFNVVGGDGNTWSGGDVESCSTMFHLAAAATSSTIVGLRSENSTVQYLADSGSSYNSVMMGGTLFTGDLVDNGSRNSFWDAFHRTWNGIKGDWYASQQDATITNHWRLGTGTGNERGLMNEIQTDYGYRWTYGFTDATAGEQFWQVNDSLNNVARLSIGQGNHGGSVTNQQTGINSAGNGAVVINGSNNAGTGGVVIGSGGTTSSEVAAIDNAGNQTLLGQLNWYQGSTATWSWECQYTAGCTLQDTGATTPGRVFKANANGQTDIDSQGTSTLTVNNTSTGGTGGFTVYGGGASYYNTAVFAIQPNGTGGAYYKFPTIASSSGEGCAQLDDSGYLSNTGNPCGTGSGSGTVTSVGLSGPSIFDFTGTPVTGSGTLNINLAGQTPNTVWAGPATGSNATPTFRALVSADIPVTIASNTSGSAGSVPYSGLTGTIPTWNQSTTGNAATASAVPYSGLTGTVPTWNQSTTGNAATASAVPYSGLTGTVPTWNQSTTGNAAGLSSSGDVIIDPANSSWVKVNGGTQTTPGSNGIIVYNYGNSGTTEFVASNSGNSYTREAFGAMEYYSSGTMNLVGSTGCSVSTSAGGQSVGTFTWPTAGACTFTLTMTYAAVHGYNCIAEDQSTPADAILQTASSTTSCTFGGVGASGDIIRFIAFGY